MSADNGIYIGKFTDGYRVAHAQAIENCFESMYCSREEADAYITLNFGNCKLLKTESEAWSVARNLYEEIMDGDFPILEYGVRRLDFSNVSIPLVSHEVAMETINRVFQRG